MEEVKLCELEYYINNPSAWEGYSEEGSQLLAKALSEYRTHALEYKYTERQMIGVMLAMLGIGFSAGFSCVFIFPL